MKNQRRTLNASLKGPFFVACAVMALCLSQAAFAQSGRRSKSAPSPPTPIAPDPQAEPTPTPAKAKPAPRLSLVVGKDTFGSTDFVVSSYVSDVLRACIDRINDSSDIQATGGSDMSRKDASDRAKKGSAYVLRIELRTDQFATSTSDIGIDYSVYTPQTGKVLTSGRVYLGTTAVGRGGVGVGVPNASSQYPLQYQMRAAGQEVADRVLGKLSTVSAPEEPR